ncbi:hypothetical protein RRG08_048297 [Elysia crispata]|uniref:Uncharacterized protein n=1 Tax=Elysia crispata TaxID=231223 RepID=A0AAE0ZTG5_9GAST|nr:hypothetical protein RRG08_048297 [Elysia crispata]
MSGLGQLTVWGIKMDGRLRSVAFCLVEQGTPSRCPIEMEVTALSELSGSTERLRPPIYRRVDDIAQGSQTWASGTSVNYRDFP